MQKQVKPSAQTWTIDLILLTVVIGLIYSIFLGYPPLAVPDEARYSEIPREMLAMQDFITPHLNLIKYFEKPPLFYWMQTVSIKLFGLSEHSMRLMTMLMGITGCLLTYSTARALYNRTTGLLSAAILSSCFLYYGMSHLITLDMTFGTFISGTLFAFILAVNSTENKKRRCFMTLCAVSCALAVLTKGLAGLILPGMVVFFWLLMFNEWKQLKTLFIPSAIIIFLIITVPWHVMVQLKNPEFFHYYFVTQQFSRYFTLSAGRYQPNWFFIPILLAGVFPWTGFLFQALWHHCKAIKRHFRLNKNAGFFLLWATSIFIFFSASHSKLIPYIIPVFAPLAILIGSYFTLDKRNPFGIIVFILLSLTLASAAIVSQSYIPATPTAAMHLTTLAIIFTLGALCSGIVYYRKKTKHWIIPVLITCALAYPIINRTIPHIDDRSIKTLALELKPRLQPNDVVINYKHYYQDLPFYIERETLIADWRNELDFGARHQQDGPERLITIPEALAIWNSNQTVYFITRSEYYDELLENQPNIKMYLVKRTPSNVLISNKDPQK